MNDFWTRLERDMDTHLRAIPRPFAPMPACVLEADELPTDRSDFTKDAEASGT